jgi:glyoxylase-like metal-dependent hydrolase (beta-lactamase superfamily II)
MKHLPALAHGELSEVLHGIWFVQGTVKMPMLMPMKISRSMTVLRNPANNELTLVNSIRLDERGLARLEKLGKVAHVIRLAGFHGRDDGFYRDKYGARVHALRGHVYTRKLGVPMSSKDAYMEPDSWLDEKSTLPVPNASLKLFKTADPAEGMLLLHRDGGVLIAGDALQNTPRPDEYVNLPARFMMKKMGFFKPCNVGPAWLQFAKPEASEVRSILDLDFEHVLPAHGGAVIGGAKEKFRPALEGELKGCHA